MTGRSSVTPGDGLLHLVRSSSARPDRWRRAEARSQKHGACVGRRVNHETFSLEKVGSDGGLRKVNVVLRCEAEEQRGKDGG